MKLRNYPPPRKGYYAAFKDSFGVMRWGTISYVFADYFADYIEVTITDNDGSLPSMVLIEHCFIYKEDPSEILMECSKDAL